MSGEQIGIGSITVGSLLVGVFDAETGLTVANSSVPAINVQKDTDTNIKYCAGDSTDPGGVTASVLPPAGFDFNAIVRTTETLTITYPSGDTEAGSAFLLSANRDGSANAKNLVACSFQWEEEPTFTAA